MKRSAGSQTVADLLIGARGKLGIKAPRRTRSAVFIDRGTPHRNTLLAANAADFSRTAAPFNLRSK
jgi:hypothetical protein